MDEDVHVAIIGAGFGGIGAAIRLREEGFEDLVVLERNASVGGTWWHNTYPGCACDVPAHLYSFSFALNPDWSRMFAPQEEILAYLRRTARDRGVLPLIRFGADLQSARWDDDARRWRIETTAGALSARVLISAAGPLSEPCRPDVPGLGDFAGPYTLWPGYSDAFRRSVARFEAVDFELTPEHPRAEPAQAA